MVCDICFVFRENSYLVAPVAIDAEVRLTQLLNPDDRDAGTATTVAFGVFTSFDKHSGLDMVTPHICFFVCYTHG